MSTWRAASLAGWLTLVGVLVFEVIGPVTIVGPRITGSTARPEIESYYAHEALVWFALGALAPIGAFIVLVTAMRSGLVDRLGRTLWADVGWGSALVAAALLLTRSGLEMALVRGVEVGADVVPTFLAWDFIYNTAVYAMEAVYPFAFALAFGALPTTPRWYVGLGAGVAGLQVINMTSLVLGLPDVATLPGNVSFAVWLGVTAWLLGRPVMVREAVGRPAHV